MNALGPVLALFWRAEPRRLLLGGVLSVMTLLAGAALLGLSGWFITASALAGATAASALAFDVFRPAAAIRALALIRTAGRYGERLVTHDATLGVLATLRVRLFRGWADPQAARSLLARPARLLHRLTCDVDALDGLYLRILLPLSGAAATWLVIGLMLGFTATVLAVPLVLLVASAGGVSVWATRASAREARLRTHAAEAHRVRIADLLGGQVDWIMAGRLPARRAGVLDAEARLGQAEDRLHRIETRAALGFGVLATLVLATTLLIAGMLADAGEIPAPMAVLAVLLAFAAAEPLGLLRRLGGELGRTLLAARRIGPRLQPADVPRREHPAPRAGLAVELRGVSVCHPGMDRPAVQDVSLTIAQHERVALIGPSGAGKSTLLALLAGELAATGGTVAALPAALMPQRTELFHDTVEGNLRLAAPDASAEALRSCLADAGLEVDPDALLGEGGAGLSTGQARRLVLARHLLRDAPVWLLDEPTDGLQDVLGRDILGRIATLTGPRTLVISTHLRREAALADRLVVISGGRITASHRRGEAGFGAALAALRDG